MFAFDPKRTSLNKSELVKANARKHRNDWVPDQASFD